MTGLSAPYFYAWQTEELVADAEKSDQHEQGKGGEAGDGGEGEGHDIVSFYED